METNQQNHQTSIQSTINRTSPESEQYTREFIYSIYQSLNGTKASKTKARRFKSRKTTITNLSSYNLSEAEKNLLGKGLNFIPTQPREHPAIILQDYLLFDRKLRLRYYFEDKETKPQEQPISSILKHSTGWTCPGSQDQNFDSHRHLTQCELINELNIASTYKRFNLPKPEINAIKSLANNNNNITIKPADKGGKIVIQDTMDYIKECEQQLNDTTYYRRLYSDPTQEMNNNIKEKLERSVQEGNLTPAELETLYNSNPRIPNFYTLPKIHKINNPD